MRFLADENLPKSIVDELRSAGHDVLWARTDFQAAKDLDLLKVAESQSRIVLTLDKDFRQIALQRREPLKRAGVVLFRAHPATAGALRPLVQHLYRTDMAWAGHVSTISPNGIQMLAVG